VLLPEDDGIVAAQALDLRLSRYSEKRFDGLQPTAVAEAFQHEPEVNVGLVEAEGAEVGTYKRKVEEGAVEGDQEIETLNRVLKLLEVFAVDELIHALAVVEADDGDVVSVGIRAGGLDVEEGAAMLELAVESPAFGSREPVMEVGRPVPIPLRGGEILGETTSSHRGHRPALEMPFQVVPGEDPLTPEVQLCPRPDGGEMDKGVVEHGGVVIRLPHSFSGSRMARALSQSASEGRTVHLSGERIKSALTETGGIAHQIQ